MELIYWCLFILCIITAIVVGFIPFAGRVWLSGFMGFLAAYVGLIILDSQDFFVSPSLYFLLLTSVFLPGPLLLGYVSHISSRNEVSGKDFTPCFLPLAIVLTNSEQLGVIPLLSTTTVQAYQSLSYVSLFNLLSIMAGIQVLIYLSRSFWLVFKLRQDWTGYRSQSMPKSWYKMAQLLVLILLISVLQIASAFLHPAGNPTSIGDISFIAVVCYFLYLAISTSYKRLYTEHPEDVRILHFPKYLISPKHKKVEKPQVPSDTTTASEQHDSDDDIAYRQLAEQIKQQMQPQLLFLQEDLSLTSLAEQLEITPHQLSDMLNKHFNKNFYEFVNDHRIQYAAEALISSPNTPITEIYYAAGFTTKSTFYSHFKRVFNCSPSSYRRNHCGQ